MQKTPPTSRALALLAVLVMLSTLGVSVMAGSASAAAPASTAALAYAQDGRVWLVVEGRGPRALNETGYAAEAALSPDGLWVAYLLTPDSALGQAPLPAQLWLADVAGQGADLLADDLALRSQLSWSPDGAQLALVEQGQLVVVDVASGRREIAADGLASDGLSYAGYAWLPDNSGLVCLTQDDAGARWVETTGSDDRRRLQVPTHLSASAVALSPGGQAVTLLSRGALYELWLDGGALSPLETAGEAVTAFAWSSVGARLACASPSGDLWSTARRASGLTAPQPLAALSAPVVRLTWRGDQIETTLATRGGQAAASVSLQGALRTAGLAPRATAASAPPERPILAEVGAYFAWYRAQGDPDSGTCASTNCGPTTVAMAIEFARNDLYVPISEIRTQMTGTAPCGSGTNSTQLVGALSAWSVPYQYINGMSAVRDAINQRGHVVIVPVIMADIAPGSDYEVWDSNPATTFGRYYGYALGHWLVARGISADGQWVKVYDPNVWDSGKYRYSDGALKGVDRLYPYGEFAVALSHNGNWAIEIMAAAPTPPPPDQAPSPPTNVAASQGAYADRVALTWTPPARATFYTVHRAETAAGARQLLGFPAQPAWDDAAIAADTTGYYWVTACNTSGCSDYAGPESGYRGSEPTPTTLPAPASFTASAWSCTDDVDLAWAAVSGATHYQVRRATNAGGAGEVLSQPAETQWGDASATPGQAYWYRAAACNTDGCGALSTAARGVRAYPLLPPRSWMPLVLFGR